VSTDVGTPKGVDVITSGHEPSSAHERLAVLVGRWRTEGSTMATAGSPAAKIEATDTYEWLPGRFGLLHTVDARVGDEQVEGAEIIGWVPERDVYRTQYFGSGGPNTYEASLTETDGVLVWTMRSATDRFTGTFSDDRNRITGRWERLGDETSWQPWMEVMLTRSPT
jgi:Protein of unknown function (DUF1579)